MTAKAKAKSRSLRDDKQERQRQRQRRDTGSSLLRRQKPSVEMTFGVGDKEANDCKGGVGMMTIGHSTLELGVFLRALGENGCRVLVDVRRFPGSRRYPWFGQEALFEALEGVGIRGVWREGLGGRRAPLKDSVNLGWRNESFRGYADYMQTPAFAAEIDWLVESPELEAAVVMCAEAVPWRCHRSLIGDAVLARGFGVEDIFVDKDGGSSRRPHAMTDFARVDGRRVWYPREGGLFS